MFLHYLRTALAGLRLRKQTTLINVIGLTLGMTCFIVAYVITDYLASADRHYANHERIYMVQQRNVAPGDDSASAFRPPASKALAAYLRTGNPELEAIARRTDLFLRVDAGDDRFGLNATFADADLLRIFDFGFIAGDPATALDEPTSAVLSDRVANLLFGTTDALGRVFSVSRQVGRPFDFVVRGVVRETKALSTLGFPHERSGILLNFAAWEAMPDPQRIEPLDRTREDWSNEDLRSLTFVLLPEDGSLTAAELDRRLAKFAARVVPDNGDTVSFRARSLSTYFDDLLTAILATLGVITGIQARMLFFVPGVLILAMACFNYINLTVAIAATRAKEVGMSKVLGASARQVIQQHLFEAAAAVVVAFASAFVLATLLTALINTAFGFTIGFAGAIDGWFWLTAISIMLGTTIIAGAYPAWVMSRFRPLESLRIGSKRSGSGVLRSLFIGSQFAIASVLLTAVLVMYSQNAAMRRELDRLPTDPYVQIDNNLIETPDVDPEVLIAALLRSPSIKAATGMAEPVFSATLAADPFSASQAASTTPPVNLRSRFISYDFFSTLGIELLAGRSFVRDRDRVQRRDAAQSQSGALGVVIDREAAAMLGWPNPQDAVGRTIYQQTRTAAGLGTTGAIAFEIIGVVDKAPLQGVSGGLSNIYRLDPYNSSLILRLAPDDVPAALAHIEAVWRDLVPDSRLRNVRFIDQTFELAIFEMNILATALLSIVAFGFLVALAGIFGMALFVASRRRHEIGIRKSLGAGTKQILRQLLVEFGKPVLIGNVIAWPAAYALAQLYVQLYLERAPLTPWPYLLSLAITLAIAWLGFGRQALLASRLQPARVLRYE